MPRPQSVFVGDVFGRLTVKAELLDGYVACLCECGNVHVSLNNHLISGKTKSCGCLHSAMASQRAAEVNKSHGMSYTRVYRIWRGMLHRCYNPKNIAYKHYGARGITVCGEWMKFEKFLTDMGAPEPRLTLERENNSLGYSKSNCYWATYTEQANNKRTNVLMTFMGRTQTAMQWAEELGFTRYILYERKAAGWSDERALTTPVRKKRR